MIIDSHCHLESNKYKIGLEEIVKKANQVGVKYMLSICTDNESFEKILKILKNFNNIYGTYGIHPHEVKNYKVTKNDITKNILKHPKIIGIGETGLDFYYNHSEKNDQIECFEKHIKASQELDLPLIIHTRSAENETLEILKKNLLKKEFKILIHCFTGSKKFAFKLLDLGAYISASGVVTFKKSEELAYTFKDIPNEKILVETDSPYLAPVPLRGKSNEPSYLVHTVEFLSKLKKISYDEFSKITSNNFFKLFGNLN